MDEYLWPARNVAEYAYCPRLFYLMEVEGLHAASADTVQGNATHRRVDRPSAEAAESDDGPKSIRSLTLTSHRLGLTATLDLAELDGSVAVPVEYRKGRPRRVAPAQVDGDASEEADQPPAARAEPWPTDRVQVGLQALLLQEAGYTVNQAILYYAQEKLRLPVTVDEALKAEALATLQAARAVAGGPRPLPLVNDSRCARCSLQPICLPDEVNHQRVTGTPEAEAAATGGTSGGPRKLWPLRDDCLHLVAQQEGVRIGVRGMTLTVIDRDGKVTREVPLPLPGMDSPSVLKKHGPIEGARWLLPCG